MDRTLNQTLKDYDASTDLALSRATANADLIWSGLPDWYGRGGTN